MILGFVPVRINKKKITTQSVTYRAVREILPVNQKAGQVD